MLLGLENEPARPGRLIIVVVLLIIVTTHPIQYQTPIWQALARDGRVPFEVWYLTRFGVEASHDREFGATFRWDIDTLGGYPRRFLQTAPGAVPTDFRRCRVTESLCKRLAQIGAKAVWIQGWQVAGYWQAAWAAEAVGAELWLRAESNDLQPTPRWKRLVKRLVLGYLFSKVDRFLCIGTANRRLYLSYGVPEARLVAAPYAVDNERFATQAAALRPCRAELRRQWGIAEDAFCVLFCGKLVGKKRPLDLVAAARRLQADGRIPEIHLLFAGAGELGGKLRASCNVVYDSEMQDEATSTERGELPRASFAGFLNQTEISRAYVAADCLVLPSDHGETWGLVVNEAMVSGLPCIVSDACGCAEDLVRKEWSFPIGNVEALVSALANFWHRRPEMPARPLPVVQDTVSTILDAYGRIGTATGARHLAARRNV